jgi:hypothetical protein
MSADTVDAVLVLAAALVYGAAFLLRSLRDRGASP